jgi:deoxyribodipyrimidine photo-lyase
MPGVVWFRRDLRLSDNPAWAAATGDHDHVVGLFVVQPQLMSGAGAHRRSLLLTHLHSLDTKLSRLGGRLRVRFGDPATIVPLEAQDADCIYWNDDYTPFATSRDAAVARALGPPVRRFDGNLVHKPGSVLTAAGSPYRVFTPFYRRWSSTAWDPQPKPGNASVADEPGDELPKPEFDDFGGERAALDRLEQLLERIDDYDSERNRPDLATTSRLSADLKFGTISPRLVARTVGEHSEGRAAYVRQLGWRDFYAHILHYFPETTDRPMDPRYERIRWRHDDADFAAWIAGKTGYPIVDAGMRQLLAEGWMHNRVRLITASFLVKDLLIDWRRGERHFRHHLADADRASNVGNWQWVAGTGADAAPYFRILNPIRQAERFDPSGDFVRRYVPELRDLDGPVVHAPWKVDPIKLASAGIDLGVTYPGPIVDHAEAREHTLAAYAASRNG